jgi:hypothetical protein
VFHGFALPSRVNTHKQREPSQIFSAHHSCLGKGVMCEGCQSFYVWPNPWRRNDKTAQAQFVKRDPDLAKFYQAEAKDVEIPLFGRNRNLTIEGRLAKDPDTFALVKTAQRIHEQWRAEDKLAAENARKQAEATLRRLETETSQPVRPSRAMIGT